MVDDTYFKKLSARLLQKADLLTSKPDFQKDISLLRTEWHIPSNGFKDQESTEKWHKDFYASENEYFKNVWGKRRHEIVKLNKTGQFREARELTKQINDAMPINALRIATKNLLVKYKIPLNWENSIRRYLFFNDISKMNLPGGIWINVKTDEDTELRKLSIEIQDDTTLEDVKAAWPDVKFHQSQLHSHTKDKFQPIKKLQRDKKAFELHTSGKSYKEIADILSDTYDEPYSYSDVGSFIKRYKEKVGIN